MKTYLLNIENIPTVILRGVECEGTVYIEAERLITFLDEHITLIDTNNKNNVISNEDL